MHNHAVNHELTTALLVFPTGFGVHQCCDLLYAWF